MQANIFGVMETLRQHALVEKQLGPKLLIVGSAASGKSELARTFVNYSVKIGWPTAFLELDSEHPETSVPGMLTASVVAGEYLSYDGNEINKLAHFVPFEKLAPDNFEIFASETELLFNVLEKRFLVDRDNHKSHWKLKATSSYPTEVDLKHRQSLFASGAVISAPSFFADQPPQFVKRLVRIVKPQIIVVLDHDGLYTALRDTPECRVLHIPKTGGAMQVTEEQEKQIRTFKFDSYFFDDRFMCNRDQVPVVQLPIYRLVKTETESSELTAPNMKYALVKVDPTTSDVSKNVLGVLSLQHKQLQMVVAHSPIAAAEGVLKSPLVSLIYLYELKGVDGAGQSADAVIIRPTSLQKSYLDLVWIVGDHRYHHN